MQIIENAVIHTDRPILLHVGQSYRNCTIHTSASIAFMVSHRSRGGTIENCVIYGRGGEMHINGLLSLHNVAPLRH